MKNILIILIVVLIIVLAGLVGVIAFMNSQNSDAVPVFINNSTNDTVSDKNNDGASADAKFFCERCDVWVLESDSKVHNEKYHQFTCEVCGKKVWESGNHVDGSPYHNEEESDDSIVTTDTYRFNKDGELTNKQLNPNSDKYAYDQY